MFSDSAQKMGGRNQQNRIRIDRFIQFCRRFNSWIKFVTWQKDRVFVGLIDGVSDLFLMRLDDDFIAGPDSDHRQGRTPRASAYDTDFAHELYMPLSIDLRKTLLCGHCLCFYTGANRSGGIRIQRPARARFNIKRIAVTGLQAFQPGPSNHCRIVGAERGWWNDEANILCLFKLA